jgi:hypothetical protein
MNQGDSSMKTKSSITKIDSYTVIQEMTSVVSEFGTGYVYKDHYTSCANFVLPSGQLPYGIFPDSAATHPACIVGKIMHRLDFTINECGNGSVGSTVEKLRQNGVEVTPGAAIVLAAAQGVQDNGGTWGVSLNAAQRVFDTLHVVGIER